MSTRVQARANAEEMAYVATEAAKRLNQYENKGRVKAVIPLRGFSSLSVPGGPLHDPEADRAFINALKKHLDPAIESLRSIPTSTVLPSPRRRQMHCCRSYAEAAPEEKGRNMRKVEFVDQTIRDGQQSLWG